MFETGISLFFFFFKVQYLNCFLCPWWYDLKEGNVCSLSLPFVWLSRFFPVLFAVIAPAEHSLLQTSLAQTSLLASGLQICSSFQVCLIELKDFYWIPLPSLRVFLQLLVSSLWGMCSPPGILLGWTPRTAGESADMRSCVLLPFSRTVLQLLFWSYPSDPVFLQGHANNRFWPNRFRFLGKPL